MEDGVRRGDRVRLVQEGHEDVVGEYLGRMTRFIGRGPVPTHHVRDERNGMLVQVPVGKGAVVAEPSVVEDLDDRSEGDLPPPPADVGSVEAEDPGRCPTCGRRFGGPG